jgi:hypothetical protein
MTEPDPEKRYIEAISRLAESVLDLYAELPHHRQQKPEIVKAVEFATSVNEPETWRARHVSIHDVREQARGYWSVLCLEYQASRQAGEIV